jgi:CHAD domain-containing protein
MPASEGARRVALALLDAVALARPRLDDRNDPEALHDFRVALRRLRSWIRAFQVELRGSVKKKHRHRLQMLSREAGVARDAEVHVAWLLAVQAELKPRERPGAEWLLKRLTAHQHAADASLHGIVADMYDAEVSDLGDDLAVFRVRVDLRDPVPPPTLAQVIAPLILNQTVALRERLAGVQSMQDQAVAHAARIAGKRLRYLLEPIAEAVEGAPAFVRRLRGLQDTIGEMHDVHVMAEEVIRAAEEAGAERGRLAAAAMLEGAAGENGVHRAAEDDPRPGLLAIATKLRDRGHRAFSELEHQWIGEHTTEVAHAARTLVAHITGSPASVLTSGETPDDAHANVVGTETGATTDHGADASSVQERNGSAMLEQLDAGEALNGTRIEAPPTGAGPVATTAVLGHAPEDQPRD